MRVYPLGPDEVLCLLEGTESSAERTLREVGHARRVRETRSTIQYAREEELHGLVERILGRRVRAYVNGLNAQADASVDLFLLEPGADADGPAPPAA